LVFAEFMISVYSTSDEFPSHQGNAHFKLLSTKFTAQSSKSGRPALLITIITIKHWSLNS